MGRKFLGEIKHCIRCDKEMKVSPSAIRRGKGRFCSKLCFNTGKTIQKTCEICSKKFEEYQTRIEEGRGKFCSESCYRISRKGKPAWNKGKPAPWAIGNKHRLGKTNPNPYIMVGIDNPQWKGDDVKYEGLHSWVKTHLGKPITCEFCGHTNLKGREIHWANKSHKYLRDISDWLRLCANCHAKYDKSKGFRKRN